MEILKTATEWAKSEVFSSLFFVLFGVMFVVATIGFWQLGKTDIAKAFIYPTLVSGILLLVLGFGLFFTNKARITSFPEAYKQDATAFVEKEISRTEQSIGEYQVSVFVVIPLIIVVAALLIIFIDKPIWRAISVTTLALMIVIQLVDNNAHARLKDYHQALVASEK